MINRITPFKRYIEEGFADDDRYCHSLLRGILRSAKRERDGTNYLRLLDSFRMCPKSMELLPIRRRYVEELGSSTVADIIIRNHTTTDVLALDIAKAKYKQRDIDDIVRALPLMDKYRYYSNKS